MYLFMPIVYDAVVIFVIISSVIFSYKKGFLRSILSLISYCVSFFIANFLGRFVSQIVFDNFIKANVEHDIFNTLNNSLSSGNVMNSANKISSIIPDWLTSHLIGNKTIDDVAGGFIAKNDLSSASSAITNQIFRPYVIMIISIVAFFVLFAAVKLLFRYIYMLTSVLERMPVIGALNGLLGGLCGVVKAGILLFIIAIIVFVVILITKNEMSWINTGIINETHLFFMFYKFIPFIK